MKNSATDARKKVLIVEDDVNINRALSIRMRASGYEVVSAADAYLGLSTAIAEQPDVVILDITMPAGDGFGIVDRMREHPELASIPIIFLTASKRPEYKQRALSLRAHSYFEKPYEAADLLESVHDALHGTHGVWDIAA